MTVRTVGIIMNGVTGRMGTNQHLIRSIAAIREQGGVSLPDGDVLIPNPILVGRNENKLRALAQAHGIERWSTDLGECLANPEDEIYFDAQATTLRPESIKAAIRAGKQFRPAYEHRYRISGCDAGSQRAIPRGFRVQPRPNRSELQRAGYRHTFLDSPAGA